MLDIEMKLVNPDIKAKMLQSANYQNLSIIEFKNLIENKLYEINLGLDVVILEDESGIEVKRGGFGSEWEVVENSDSIIYYTFKYLLEKIEKNEVIFLREEGWVVINLK